MNVKIPLQNKKDLILYKEICLSKIQETVNDQNSNFDQKTMQKIKRRLESLIASTVMIYRKNATLTNEFDIYESENYQNSEEDLIDENISKQFEEKINELKLIKKKYSMEKQKIITENFQNLIKKYSDKLKTDCDEIKYVVHKKNNKSIEPDQLFKYLTDSKLNEIQKESNKINEFSKNIDERLKKFGDDFKETIFMQNELEFCLKANKNKNLFNNM